MQEQYNKAYELYQAGKNNEALTALQDLLELLKSAENVLWLRPWLLQCYILRNLDCPVQEMEVLEGLVEKLAESDNLSDGDRQLGAEIYSLLGEVCCRLGECSLAVEAFLQSANWEQDKAQKLIEYSNAIFTTNYCDNISHKRWHKLYDGYRKLLQNIQPLNAKPKDHQKIRIGYLSGDIRRHPVAYFLRPLLEYTDRERFAVYLYQTNQGQDSLSEKLHGWADCVRMVSGRSHEEIAGCIAEDEIDILVDLSGHTCDNHLPVLAYRPAPVEISAIGYFNSTGLSIDGFLSDKYCSPSSYNADFQEPLLQLPDTHFCYSPDFDYPQISLQSPWQKNGYITFGCYNNFSKVTDELLQVWAQILQQCPQSRLILKHKLFDSVEGRQWTVRRLENLALPVERIELRGFSADYLQQYNDVDIALDTYPYTGGLTTMEALLMGVPVVSRYGSRHGTRFGLSFLSNIGLDMLAAANWQEYVQKALLLAKNPELLQDLRHQIPQLVKNSPLMDGKSYCQAVEKLYIRLYKNRGLS